MLEGAGLVAPEMQIATAPYVIGFLNGAASLIDYGLTSCNEGWGDQLIPLTREIKACF